MPPAPVYWLVIQEHFDDLVVGTYGRGFWILDDVSPLRALDSRDAGFVQLELVEPRATAYRFNQVQGIKAERSHVTGRNPAGTGGPINYWVGEGWFRSGPNPDRRFAAGDTVRVLTGPRTHGDESGVVGSALRAHPHTSVAHATSRHGLGSARSRTDGGRLRTWDLDLFRGQLGPRVVPGTYTVRIDTGRSTSQTADDRSVEGSVLDGEHSKTCAPSSSVGHGATRRDQRHRRHGERLWSGRRKQLDDLTAAAGERRGMTKPRRTGGRRIRVVGVDWPFRWRTASSTST